jgi:serine protease Do
VLTVTQPANAEAAAVIEQSPARDPVQALSQAAVALRVNNTLVAQGVVIANDGRIVTCLSALGGNQTLEVRYPNGRVANAFLVAQDPEWNLALLQPRTGSWSAGVALAPGTRRGTRATISMGDPPGISALTFARRRTFVMDAVMVRDAWQLDPLPTSNAIGSGVLNERGQLAAVIVADMPVRVRAMPVAMPPGPFGAPSSAIANMLQQAGSTARPWLGFTARALAAGESIPGQIGGGLRVLDVANGGPAMTAGLAAGATPDHVVSADGVPLRVEAELAGVLARHRPGDIISLRVVRGGRLYDVALTLGTFPSIGP